MRASNLTSEARKYIGMSGRPNKATEWYSSKNGSGYLRAAWCDMFVSYCGNNTGMSAIVGIEAYTPTHVNWFKKRGQWGSRPRVGAIVFFNWGGRGGLAQHVGIVESVRPNGVIVTIEGNTSDRVQRKVRDKKFILGYGYPAFNESGSKPKPDPDGYPGKVIEPGETGEHIKKLKARLVALGYKDVKSGNKYGPHAQKAVADFKKKNGLKANGRVGRKAWRKLFG